MIEVVLYFAIIAFILFAIMNFTMDMILLNKKSEILHEAHSNIQLISNQIISSVESAHGINLEQSVFDSVEGVLSLNMSSNGLTQKSIYFSEGDIMILETDNDPIKINSNFLKCTKLEFTRITENKVPDQILVNVELQLYGNSSQSSTNIFPFHFAVSLRGLK